MTMVPRGVLWDMDGVLVDSAEYHFHSWRQTLAALGVLITREDFRNTFGRNNDETLKMLLGSIEVDADPESIYEAKEAAFRWSIRGQLSPMPGVVQWLERFRKRDVKQAIASSAPMENIEAIVHELSISHYFTRLVAGQELPSKPDPDIFLEAARLIGAPPERCVVFEDSISGVLAAKRAGMRCIAVTTSHTEKELQAADIVVDSLSSLLEV